MQSNKTLFYLLIVNDDQSQQLSLVQTINQGGEVC